MFVPRRVQDGSRTANGPATDGHCTANRPADGSADGSAHDSADGAGSGIIGMLEVIESDFSKGLAEMISVEETAQAEYERIPSRQGHGGEGLLHRAPQTDTHRSK